MYSLFVIILRQSVSYGRCMDCSWHYMFYKYVLSNFDIGQERNQLKALYNYINPQILLPPRLRDISIIINSPKLQMYIHSLDKKKIQIFCFGKNPPLYSLRFQYTTKNKSLRRFCTSKAIKVPRLIILKYSESMRVFRVILNGEKK